MYLHYIAVSKTAQRMGLGTLMLLDALKRANFVSQHVAFFGVGLRSLNDDTTRLYERYGFGIAPDEDKHPLMILPIWTIRELFNK
jgi:ribosomal protein S18 acetylase RimI-like enzyme